MELELQPMQAKHLNGVLSIERVSFPSPWSRQAFLGEIYHNEFASYFVCLKDGQVIGYGGMWVVLDEAHITNIAVHPDYRGQKVGKFILEGLLHQAALSGANRVTLEVRASNKIAQRLYANAGFVHTGIRKGYYTDTGEDALLMWKPLAAPLTAS